MSHIISNNLDLFVIARTKEKNSNTIFFLSAKTIKNSVIAFTEAYSFTFLFCQYRNH